MPFDHPVPAQHLNRRLQLRNMLAVVVYLNPWPDRRALDNPAPAVGLQGSRLRPGFPAVPASAVDATAGFQVRR